MKRMIALLLLLALLLSGCAPTVKAPTTAASTDNSTEPVTTVPPEDPAQTAEPDDPVATKEAGTFGLSYLPNYGFNPYTCMATANRATFSLIYESLFVVSKQFRAEPVLCKSFRVADDGKSYIFTLEPDACFSDGTKVTAQDVLVSVQAARKSGMYDERLEDIVDMSAQEDGTFRILLDTPYENFCLMLDVPIVKAGTVEEPKPIGSGPYWVAAKSLQRNRNWWQKTAPIVDAEEIPLTAAETSNDLRDSFEFGETDLIYCDPNSAASGGYRCDYEAWGAPTTILHYIGFNLYSGYFANDALRIAVTYAIDRSQLATEVYGGFAQGTELPCNPSSDLFNAQLADEHDYAPAKFSEALSNSGVLTSSEYANYAGFFLVCSEDQTKVEAANRICAVLKEAGLNLTVKAMERDAFLEALDDGDFDLYYAETRLTANFDLSEFFSKNGNLQYGSIANTGLAALCNDALENSGSYYDLCAQILGSAPICPVVFKSYAIFVTRGMLGNISPAVDFVFHTEENARTLSDADQTYAIPGTTEPDVPTETSAP